MHYRKLLLIISALLVSCGVFAADDEADYGHIAGKVTTTDGKPVAAVSVTLKGTRKMSVTQENGEFSLRQIKPGNYELEVSFVGYDRQVQAVTVSGNETAEVNVTLNVSSVNLKEYTVKDIRNPYKETAPSNSLRLNGLLIEQPQNIQVVTGRVLADQQIINMGDGVTRNVSGATRIEHWGDLYARINMRGSRASSFRNGMNITSTWGPLTEDMSVVDHIEFVKGPAGFLMSNGEPSGIYNIVTKKPTGITKGEVSFMTGSYDLYRGTLDLDGKLTKNGKLLYRLNVMGQLKNSFRDYEFNKRYSIAPVLTYKFSDRTSLTLEYMYQHVNMFDAGSFYVFHPDGYAKLPRNFTTAEPGIDPTIIDDHSVQLNFQHSFSRNWKLTVQGAYTDYMQEGSTMWPIAVNKDATMIRGVGIWDALNKSEFGQAFLNGEFHTGPVQHKILTGIDVGNKHYLADWGQTLPLDSNNAFFDPNNPKYGSPVMGLPKFDRSKSLKERAGQNIVDQFYTGVYVQDELGFFDNTLRLTLAGRFTYVQENSYGTKTYDNRFTPRIGLSYSIDKSFSVYALYDQSFMPQTGVLEDQTAKVKPITGNNLEAGLKKDWLEGKWNTTLSVYRIIKDNELTPGPANSNYSIQLGQTKSQGVEFDIRGEIVKGLSLVANYAYTDSKISRASETATVGGKVGDVVPGYAKHNANAWLHYKLDKGVLKGFGVSGGFSYQADRTTWSWGGAGQDPMPSYFRLDGGLFWAKDRISVNANLFNILDDYLYSGAAYADYYYWQAEPGRNFRLSVGYKF
ncbi:TonB-dependent receptor [Chitinophaga barathri]|uniref:TonB-dependent receptor n=1 Tax=Chitinophaga barathri TaxID=1647451 RepID=A0A3N4MJN6_9BACT|nr:TonB-dependent receptor [Chitinophaga barathri]RPD42087.1 TonB-dependent receptor [Chitinophaga barathri]